MIWLPIQLDYREKMRSPMLAMYFSQQPPLYFDFVASVNNFVASVGTLISWFVKNTFFVASKH